eukprot:6212031-Pleurochrysis_carterae.AAC.6
MTASSNQLLLHCAPWTSLVLAAPPNKSNYYSLYRHYVPRGPIKLLVPTITGKGAGAGAGAGHIYGAAQGRGAHGKQQPSRAGYPRGSASAPRVHMRRELKMRNCGCECRWVRATIAASNGGARARVEMVVFGSQGQNAK